MAPQAPTETAHPKAKARSTFWPVILIVLVVGGLVQVAQHFQGEKQGRALRELARPGDIVMLSSKTCYFCTQARNWLDEQRIPYRECFIETDADCAALYRAQMAPGTPTFVLRGQHRVVGFDKDRISQLLTRP